MSPYGKAGAVKVSPHQDSYSTALEMPSLAQEIKTGLDF